MGWGKNLGFGLGAIDFDFDFEEIRGNHVMMGYALRARHFADARRRSFDADRWIVLVEQNS